MQLASHGARRALKFVAHSGGRSRSLHVSSFIPRRPAPTAQRLLNQSFHLVSRFFTHLTAPGIGALPNSASSSASAVRTIHQGLSFPARHALGRPFGAPQLPRAPTVPRPNVVTNVGLGTARNFHAARPIFQNLAENVPIAGRAFWEADWNVKMEKERARMGKPLKIKQIRAEKTKEMIKSNPVEEMNQYFLEPAVLTVTTYLLIPLAPTPTTRAPLNPCSTPNLLPYSSLATLHADHNTHTLRVSTLFARLDVANVWNRGVTCTAHGDARGVCTVLKVAFAGWTANEVRSVIGESGSGWCALEEVNDEAVPEIPSEKMVDPSQSLVLPTLDVSAHHEALYDSGSESGLESDFSFDLESGYDSEEWVDAGPLDWGGFSSQFVGRVNA